MINCRKISQKFFVIALLVTTVLTSGCSTTKMDQTKKQYLKHGFYVEKNVYLTTNYGAGYCNPVNSVFFVESYGSKLFGKDYIKATSEDGRTIIIRNAEKYTNKKILQIFDEMFSEQPVDLSKHNSAVVAAIKNCKIIKGMTKDEVVLARGNPPSHTTFSLDSNVWKYWYKRMSYGVVTFDKGVVVSIDGKLQNPK